jgi:hypothetical protein
MEGSGRPYFSRAQAGGRPIEKRPITRPTMRSGDVLKLKEIMKRRDGDV